MIRHASPEDITQLVSMGLRFIRETSYAGKIAENTGQLGAIIKRLMGQATTLLLVDETHGKINGAFGAFVFNHPLSDELVAGELFWWTEPEHRGAGVRLLRRAQEWARQTGAVKMQMVAPDDRVGQFYERVGFEKVETTYQMELK